MCLLAHKQGGKQGFSEHRQLLVLLPSVATVMSTGAIPLSFTTQKEDLGKEGGGSSSKAGTILAEPKELG